MFSLHELYLRLCSTFILYLSSIFEILNLILIMYPCYWKWFNPLFNILCRKVFPVVDKCIIQDEKAITAYVDLLKHNVGCVKHIFHVTYIFWISIWNIYYWIFFIILTRNMLLENTMVKLSFSCIERFDNPFNIKFETMLRSWWFALKNLLFFWNILLVLTSV